MVVVHATAEPISPSERGQRFEYAQAGLAAIGKRCRDEGLRVAVELLPRTCLGNTVDELMALLAPLDGDTYGVCLDTNHLLQEKTEDFVRKVGSRIVTLHVADYDGIDERHWLPGKGINNWTAIIQALQEVGYRGPWMFESAGTPEEKVAVWEEMKRTVLLVGPRR